MEDQAVIVGAGHAGVSLAASLRERGFEGRIRLIGAEKHLPYQRPPLSKEFMTSAAELPKPLRSKNFYSDNAIDLLLGEPVERIDLAGRRVQFARSGSLEFTHLAIATGGQARSLPDARMEGVHVLRDLEDARAIRARVADEESVAIVGGGFIGLELAATLSALGHDVCVIEASSRLMARAVSSPVSARFQSVHESWGVRFLFDEKPARFVCRDGRLDGLVLASGQHLAVRVAVIGVGITPDTGLADAAGLRCSDGIEVDECMVAGDERVVAVGDCVRFWQHHAQRRLRLESVQNATDQARCAAAVLTGRREPYRAVPWFWSSQRQERLQIAGVAPEADCEVMRGDPAEGRFSVFRYCEGRLQAVDSLNRPAEHMVARRLIARGVSPDPRVAGDCAVELKSLLDS